jgi:hypothetical protein
VVERFMLDSMIHDKLVDEPGALELVRGAVADGSIVLLSTHIQGDQLARTPDAERASRLAAVPVESVASYGFVLDVSRFDMARFAEPGTVDRLRGDNLAHTEDALIAETALYEDATLVTEDRTLTSRARAHAIPVIGWAEFHALLLARA